MKLLSERFERLIVFCVAYVILDGEDNVCEEMLKFRILRQKSSPYRRND